MPQRLTPLEVSLLALDTAHTPGHVGTVDIFDAGPDGFDYERLIALIRERIAFVPRYRQRVRAIPAQLAGPVWVDDENFDITFHVRRSALPRPGTLAQLREFVGRVLARRLDRSRPLWEIYLVEGLEDGRLALVAKSHLCLVDGIDNVEIGQVLLDSTARTHAIPTAGVDADAWQPVPEPSSLELLADALLESAQDPTMALQNVRGALASALGVAVAVGEAVGGIGGALGDDVDFIPSATVVTSLELDTFLRGRAWSPVLVFSRPVYVGTSAAIFYRAIHAGGGFVLLDRRDGAWSITTTEGWLE